MKAGSRYLDFASLEAQRLGRNGFLPLQLSFAAVCEISCKMGDGIRSMGQAKGATLRHAVQTDSTGHST